MKKLCIFLAYYISQKVTTVERMDLTSLSRMYVKLKVIAADLGHRHKSANFNSFLMHLFF